MTLGEKLSKLRKENGHTQEGLAQLLGVSRQAVSRWESNLAYPETEKLIRIGELYNCSMDYLLKDGAQTVAPVRRGIRDFYFERKSKKMVGGLPLWHINIGYGRVAKGIFAMGLFSKGVFSMGLFSMGLVSFGSFSLGLLSLGAFALGLLAAGAISVGVVALGAVAIGLVAIGAVAIGQFAIGAAAIGNYGALGDHAYAAIAIGKTEAVGELYQASTGDSEAVSRLLDQTVPGWLKWAAAWFKSFLR